MSSLKSAIKIKLRNIEHITKRNLGNRNQLQGKILLEPAVPPTLQLYCHLSDPVAPCLPFLTLSLFVWFILYLPSFGLWTLSSYFYFLFHNYGICLTFHLIAFSSVQFWFSLTVLVSLPFLLSLSLSVWLLGGMLHFFSLSPSLYLCDSVFPLVSLSMSDSLTLYFNLSPCLVFHCFFFCLDVQIFLFVCVLHSVLPFSLLSVWVYQSLFHSLCTSLSVALSLSKHLSFQ